MEYLREFAKSPFDSALGDRLDPQVKDASGPGDLITLRVGPALGFRVLPSPGG
jgi:hypothetical protein